jgi:hypothetical protein
MLVIYLSSLVRSTIALHDLVNNKIANREAERKSEDAEREKSKKVRLYPVCKYAADEDTVCVSTFVGIDGAFLSSADCASVALWFLLGCR